MESLTPSIRNEQICKAENQSGHSWIQQQHQWTGYSSLCAPLYSAPAEHAFFSSSCGTLVSTDHTLGHKTPLNKPERLDHIACSLRLQHPWGQICLLEESFWVVGWSMGGTPTQSSQEEGAEKVLGALGWEWQEEKMQLSQWGGECWRWRGCNGLTLKKKKNNSRRLPWWSSG